LWLTLPADQGPLQDRDLHPTASIARATNVAAVLGAERFVYFHPDDDPVRNDVGLPRRASPRVEISGGSDFANRDRPLLDTLEQIAIHVDHTGDSLIADYTGPIPGYTPSQ
jgi:hypothetical protein